MDTDRLAVVVPLPGNTVTSAALHLRVAGLSALERALEFALTGGIAPSRIVLPVDEHLMVEVEARLAQDDLLHRVTVLGVAGATGDRACVCAAVRHLSACADPPDVVLLHDLPRSLASVDLWDRVGRASLAGADVVVPLLPMVDSVKAIDGDRAVATTIDRRGVQSTQSPIGVRLEVLERALRQASSSRPGVHALVDLLDDPVVVRGDPDAFPVGTHEDMALAEAILSCRRAGRR